MIKNNLNKITLAIGDGANDVNMIQAAHLGESIDIIYLIYNEYLYLIVFFISKGCGIYGNEGMRAV